MLIVVARQSKATIKQVAELAGVSITTVSHLLSGKTESCSAETANRIHEAVSRLNYLPSVFGKGLRTQRSGVIGVNAEDPFTLPFGAGSPIDQRGNFMERLWRGLTDEADSAGYPILWYPTAMRTRPTPEPFLNGSADAVIFMARHQDRRPELIEQQGVPVVLLTRCIDIPPSLGAVFTDESQVVELAMSHLWALGHRRIAHLAGPIHPSDKEDSSYFAQSDVAMKRMTCYVDWMQKWGSFDPSLVALAGGWVPYRAQQAVTAWYAMPNRPTAVFCVNDAAAKAVLEAANLIGWAVPDQLSVVGVDNVVGAAGTDPPLTTIDVGSEALGRAAIRAVVERLRSRSNAPKQVAMQISTLVVRASTAPVPDKGSATFR